MVNCREFEFCSICHYNVSKSKKILVTVELIINSTQTVEICYLGLKD